MTEEKAQFILSEIKNINRYDKIIRDLSLEIQNLLFEIESMQLPKCPTGYPKIAPTVSPSDPTSKVLELMGDESNLRKEREDFENRRAKALKYRTDFLNSCPEDEVKFSRDFFSGVSYEAIKMKHSVTHPYRHALRLIKSVL